MTKHTISTGCLTATRRSLSYRAVKTLGLVASTTAWALGACVAVAALTALVLPALLGGVSLFCKDYLDKREWEAWLAAKSGATPLEEAQ